MKHKLISAKNHIVRNRFKYGVAIGLTAGLALVVRNAREWNAFLKEYGLYDEYYAMFEEEEI